MANFLITTPGQVTRGTTNADTIVFGTAGVSAATVIGNMGADTITINGAGANFQSVDFMMNNGHDNLTIDLSGQKVASSNFFGGGKGNDVIDLKNAGSVNVFVAKGGSGRGPVWGPRCWTMGPWTHPRGIAANPRLALRGEP